MEVVNRGPKVTADIALPRSAVLTFPGNNVIPRSGGFGRADGWAERIHRGALLPRKMRGVRTLPPRPQLALPLVLLGSTFAHFLWGEQKKCLLY